MYLVEEQMAGRCSSPVKAASIRQMLEAAT